MNTTTGKGSSEGLFLPGIEDGFDGIQDFLEEAYLITCFIRLEEINNLHQERRVEECPSNRK